MLTFQYVCIQAGSWGWKLQSLRGWSGPGDIVLKLDQNICYVNGNKRKVRSLQGNHLFFKCQSLTRRLSPCPTLATPHYDPKYEIWNWWTIPSTRLLSPCLTSACTRTTTAGTSTTTFACSLSRAQSGQKVIQHRPLVKWWKVFDGKHILPLYLRGDFFGFSYNFGQIKLSQSSILRNLFSAWDPTLEQSACPPAWKSKFRSSWSWSWSSLWPGTPRAPSAPFPDGEPPLRVEASPVFSRRSFEDLMTWHEDMITWCKSIC